MAHGSRRESIPYHSHDFMELVFVAGGSTIHTIHFPHEKEVSYALITGDVFAVLPNEEHAYSESRNVSYYNVMFDFTFIADSLKTLSSLPSYQALFAADCVRNKIHLALHERKALERLLQQIANELAGRKPGFVEFVHASLIEALIIILRHDSIQGGNLRYDYSGIAASIASMEKSPEKHHSAADLAREASMSVSLFYLRFQEVTGVAPNEYLTFMRLANACAMLLESDISIGEIAVRCGFCDSNHFIKSFKKRHGITPNKFRKQFQA